MLHSIVGENPCLRISCAGITTMSLMRISIFHNIHNTMKKLLFSIFAIAVSASSLAQQLVFNETFDGCISDDELYDGFTGGNDDLWSGNIATEIVVFTDNEGWTFDNVFGANQCIKLGTSSLQGKATTPAIKCSGDVTLSFRAAPWNEEKNYSATISVVGGTAEKSTFALEKHWNLIEVKITDVTDELTITFSTGAKKQRIFLDDIKLTAAAPDAPGIRLADGNTIDFGLLGYNYASVSREVSIVGYNLTDKGITVTLVGDEAKLFSVVPKQLPAQGGTLTVTCNTGAGVGMHGAYLKLSAAGSDNTIVEKQIMLMLEVSELNLQGSGTKDNPYTVADRLLLAENDGTVWSGTYYWVSGYILGAAKRYNDTFDGICTDDKLSLVLADSPHETDMDRIVTVQIDQEAREALNVADHPENIGHIVYVQGTLLTDKGSPLYLGKPGVRDVNRSNQYVLDVAEGFDNSISPDTDAPMYDVLGRRVGNGYHGIVIQNGKKRFLY